MIYVLQEDDGGFVKIGYSKGEPGITAGLKHRLSQLQQGNPRRLSVVALAPGVSHAREKQLHAEFKEYRTRGEWFRCEGVVLEFVNRHRITPLPSGYVPVAKASRPAAAPCKRVVVVPTVSSAISTRYVGNVRSSWSPSGVVVGPPQPMRPRPSRRVNSRQFVWRGQARK